MLLIDGNAKPMTEEELVQFVRDEEIGLVGIGAMTRMVAQGLPDGRCDSRGRRAGCDGRSACYRRQQTKHWAGTADHDMRTPWRWAKLMKPGRRLWQTPPMGSLKEIYEPVDETGKERKPSLTALSDDSVGDAGSRPVQSGSQDRAFISGATWCRMGNVPYGADRIRSRMSLRL